MQRFLCVEGVPGRPVSVPDVDGQKYVAMRRRWNAAKQAHDEECFQSVVPFHATLLKAISKGDLKEWHKPVVAASVGDARAMCGLDKPADAMAETKAAKAVKEGAK